VTGAWLLAAAVFFTWGAVGFTVSVVILQAYLTHLARFGFTMIALTSFGIAVSAVVFAAGFVSEDSRNQLRVVYGACIAVGIICVALSSMVETSLMRKQCELMEQMERGDEWLNNLE
jgi:MFS family permease